MKILLFLIISIISYNALGQVILTIDHNDNKKVPLKLIMYNNDAMLGTPIEDRFIHHPTSSLVLETDRPILFELGNTRFVSVKKDSIHIIFDNTTSAYKISGGKHKLESYLAINKINTLYFQGEKDSGIIQTSQTLRDQFTSVQYYLDSLGLNKTLDDDVLSYYTETNRNIYIINVTNLFAKKKLDYSLDRNHLLTDLANSRWPELFTFPFATLSLVGYRYGSDEGVNVAKLCNKLDSLGFDSKCKEIILYTALNNLNINLTTLETITSAQKYITEQKLSSRLHRKINEIVSDYLLKDIGIPEDINRTTFLSDLGSGSTIPLFSLIQKNDSKKTIFCLWASWCGPCIASFPKIHDLKIAHPELSFVFLSMDSDKKKWLAASQKFNITSEQYLVQKNFDSPLLKHLQINSIPTYLVKDDFGNFTRYLEIDQAVNQLIK